MKRNNETYIKDAFAVIGKEGSTEDGAGFVQRLWSDANARFAEVAHLAKKDENGDLVGIWGAMTDFSPTFQPWQDGFSKGLYLWPGWNALTTHRLLTAGRNGWFLVLNTSGWNVTTMGCSQK